MGAAVNPVGKSGDPEVMVEMNTTPLIDVMLVLLIMLIITIPIQLHSVNLNLPINNSQTPPIQPEIVRIQIAADGNIFWNDEQLGDHAALEQRLSTLARLATVPELHVRPDKAARYEHVIRVMAEIQRKGLTKVGLVGSEQFL
ncbi:MAG: biopolymer transporter ExbD [Zoogloeaceae bacterium]|jgi:biopolymer transport protein ExbD|nr:biopolymer transporter ExbD [Zoogloeaceae bacterium]